ncbi:MAG TPA: electron transport complex subunit RsxG [Rhodocyclaceae bacterium]|nr:electron transport complex subunit RsxG [Rhodocyclaceae bacterium]
MRETLRISTSSAIVLVVFSLVFTGLMAITYQATKPLLEASAQAEKLKLINEVLPPASYDNDLLADAVSLPPMRALGLDNGSKLYRARKAGQPVALVLEAAAPDGYSGRIGLVLAVTADGHLSAVRVTAHKETPGLGDYIDPKKDKNKANPWIAQFNGQSHELAEEGRWKVAKDGGPFAYHTGATISARAVTNATGHALAWAAERRNALFALPTGAKFEEKQP